MWSSVFLSVTIIFLRFIYVKYVFFAFLLLSAIPLYDCLTICLAIHYAVDILGYFQLLAITNKAAVNTEVQIFVLTCF